MAIADFSTTTRQVKQQYEEFPYPPRDPADEAKRLQDMGISRFIVPPPGFTPDDLRKGLEKLGDELLAKI